MKKTVRNKVIELSGKTYRVITLEDGDIQLERFHPESRMWVVLKFAHNSPEEEDRKIEKIVEAMKYIYFKRT